MSSHTIRAKVDSELSRHVGKWFTVRQIQDRLKINPSTLKPLIMKYAREKLLKRRHVKGTARSVEFTPAAGSVTTFQQLLLDAMPYRNLGGGSEKPKMSAAVKKGAKKAAPKKAAPKKAVKKSPAKKKARK